jgi:superfamily II DNA or RNA helicase
MYLMLDSVRGFGTTLLQLPTGTGKSIMFGLMARYINKHLKDELGGKVVVVVPTEVLAAIQQYKYSPWAS